MKTRHLVKLSIISLTQRGARSWLTILGIVIGIAALISLLGIGEGARQSITSQLGGLGADIITVSRGFQRAEGFGRPSGAERIPDNLTSKDVIALKSVDGVKAVSPIISGRAEVKYFNEKYSLTVKGVEPLHWKEVTTADLSQGRFLNPSDSNSVVAGNRVSVSLFSRQVTTNSLIEIGGRGFKVVGILAESGSFGSDDNSIYMDIESAKSLLGKNDFSSIEVKAASSDIVAEVSGKMESRLMLSRNVNAKTKDFSVSSQATTEERVSGITNTFNSFMVGIAAISLLVGALGIANTMYMSVTERTKQIGLMKSLGSTNLEIMKLFLFESSFIGFTGGLAGIFVGLIVSGLVSGLGIGLMGAGRNSMAPVISPELLLFSVLFSTIIGTVSGLLPARRAAGLQPVEALRYE